MIYQVTVEQGYLKVQVSESESTGQARDLLYAVAEVVFKHGRRPILICAMGCGPLLLMDLYALARHVIDTPLRHARIAFLYDADRDFKASRFIDELGAGRGLDIGVFRTETEAAQWLKDDRKPAN
jgi:hypothetical protein